MTIEKFRVPQRSKNQLVSLKRSLGIENWNVLCRWGLTLSLHDLRDPAVERISQDSNIEMTWKTFGGQYSDVYAALLRHRYKSSVRARETDELTFFLLHLKRGISYLHDQARGKDITALFDSPNLPTARQSATNDQNSTWG